MCYSPLTLPSDYVITSEEKLRSLKQLSTVLPLYLSEVVAGETVSVYVIGDDVVVDGAPRPSVIAPSVELAKSLQLVFCQMNLVQGALGRWYCLSVNARPTLFECVDATRRTVVARLGELLCLRTRSSK
jgi:hypothetical protein